MRATEKMRDIFLPRVFLIARIPGGTLYVCVRVMSD